MADAAGWFALSSDLVEHIFSCLIDFERTEVLRLSDSGLVLVTASPTAKRLCFCESINKDSYRVVRSAAFDKVWKRLCDEYPLINEKSRSAYVAWRRLEIGMPATLPVQAAFPMHTCSVLVHVWQPGNGTSDTPSLIAAFEQPLTLEIDGMFEEFKLINNVSFSHPRAYQFNPPKRGTLFAPVHVAYDQESAIDAVPYPPLAGDVSVRRPDGHLVRLGYFDFSSPYDYHDGGNGVGGRADGYPQTLTNENDLDSHMLHLVAIRTPRHASGIFLTCLTEIVTPNAWNGRPVSDEQPPDGQQPPGGFLASLDINIHQSTHPEKLPEAQGEKDNCGVWDETARGFRKFRREVAGWVVDGF